MKRNIPYSLQDQDRRTVTWIGIATVIVVIIFFLFLLVASDYIIFSHAMTE